MFLAERRRHVIAVPFMPYKDNGVFISLAIGLLFFLRHVLVGANRPFQTVEYVLLKAPIFLFYVVKKCVSIG